MWLFDKENLTLNFDGYEIDLETCTSSAEVLDWILQISKKSWANAEVLAGLIRKLDAILHLQRNLCGSGLNTRIDVSKLLSKKR